MEFEATRHCPRWRLRTWARRSGALSCALAVAGCSGVQSALDPAGGDALRIYWLTVIMTAGATLIFVAVTGLLLYAIFAPPERRAWLGGRNTIVFGGLAFPIVVLSMLLPYGLIVMRDTDVPKAGALPIEVIGEQYWWRVRYLAEGGRPRILDRERDRRAGRPAHRACP